MDSERIEFSEPTKKLKAIWTVDPVENLEAYLELTRVPKYEKLYNRIHDCFVWFYKTTARKSGCVCGHCYSWGIFEWVRRKWPTEYSADAALMQIMADEIRNEIDNQILEELTAMMEKDKLA